MPRIFINYRRTDTGGYARSLAGDLKEYDPNDVFFDVASMDDGSRWDLEIRQRIENCRVLLVVIGPDWLKASDPESGQRRLDQPNVWVRREIEIGLKRKPRPLIIPVRVGGVKTLPRAAHLPRRYRSYAACRTARLGSGIRRFTSNC